MTNKETEIKTKLLEIFTAKREQALQVSILTSEDDDYVQGVCDGKYRAYRLAISSITRNRDKDMLLKIFNREYDLANKSSLICPDEDYLQGVFDGRILAFKDVIIEIKSAFKGESK